MNYQKIIFENTRKQSISARLDMPENNKPIAYALFAHCFTCTKNYKAVFHINKALGKVGIASLRFDFTGLGESEGDFAETNLSTNVQDIVSASEYLQDYFEAPKLLIGHSFGGAAVIRAAERIPSSVAVSTIAAPASTGQVKKSLQESADEIEEKGEAIVKIAERSFKLTREFLQDLERTRMRDSIANLRKGLLIFHSPVDDIVGIRNGYDIFETAQQPKSFISLDHADHLLSRREDSEYVGSLIGAWALRYL